DGTRLPLRHDSIEVIVSFETLEHVPQFDEFVTELRRVLKADGVLLLSTPNALHTRPLDGKPRNPFHVREFTPNELLALLRGSFRRVQLLGQRTHPRLVYYKEENRGVASARNQGAALARGEVLIFIDDDILVQPTLIAHHLETVAQFGDCLVNRHWEFAPSVANELQTTPFGRYRIEVERWVKCSL